jgi:hypothetical protein
MDYDTTVVIDRGGGQNALAYVAWLLACENSIEEREESPENQPAVDITVIVGLDFHNLFHDHDRKWWHVP